MKRAAQPLAPVPGDDRGIDLVARIRPYLRHCGDVRRPPWRIGRRRLLDILLVWIAQGQGGFQIDEEHQEVRSGDLFWVPPDRLHVMEGYGPVTDLTYIHFDLVYRPDYSHWDFSIASGMDDLGELEPLMHPPLIAPFDGLAGRIRIANHARVGQLLRTICAEASRAQDYSGLLLSGLLTQALAELLRGLDGASVPHEHLPGIERAEAFMQRRCHEELSVTDLAALAGLSASRFRRLFHDHVGRSPRDHLRYLRIERAKQLMLGTGLSLGAIGERCGFATVHSLSRAFHAVEGVAPSTWRRFGRGRVRVEGREVPYAR